MAARPGEIYMIDLGLAGKVRPGLVVSRDDDAPPRDLILVAPLTTENRGSRYEVAIGKPKFLQESSWVNLQGVQSMRPDVLLRRLGRLEETILSRVKEGLRYTFDL